MSPAQASSAIYDHDVVIIGGGLSGLCAGVKLGEDGFDYLILERDGGLGGAWWANRYPGVGVDVMSLIYSFSFFPNPDWSRTYAPGSELASYAQRMANAYGMNDRIRLNANVARSEYDADTCTWTTTLSSGEQITSRYLIGAWGILTNPKKPQIPGLEEFQGRIIHTAEWPDDGDLTGQRVAVVGTGASAVQMVPALASKVKQLNVFQRTAIWVLPKPDVAVPRVVRTLFRRLPLFERLVRYVTYVAMDSFWIYAIIRSKQLWLIVRAIEGLGQANLLLSVRDPQRRAALTPDYEFGCKRPTMSNTYYRAYNRPNVDLITSPIERVTATGVATLGGREYEVDTLVLSTGFRLWEPGGTPPVPIYGATGRELGEQWAEDGYGSYEGIAMPGYHNLFFACWAPYALTSATYLMMVETHVKKIQRVMCEARARASAQVGVREQAYRRWRDKMQGLALNSGPYQPNCVNARSYYIDQHGEAPLLRPESTQAMWASTRRRSLIKDFEFEPARAAQPVARRDGAPASA